MADEILPPDAQSTTGATGNSGPVTGAAPGGGATGGTSLGVSTSGVTVPPSDLPVLPPNYASSNLGFFTRQSEPVPTAVTVGPDGALYVSELGAIPYPTGYANIVRIPNPTSTTGFDGKIASGTPQVFASGFSEIQSMSFDAAGNLYVLEYLNANGVYDPTIPPSDLPPSKLIRVGTDGVRTTISGDELKLGNYVQVDQATGDIYVAINNADNANGEVLRYRVNADGTASNEVVASGLRNPRGMSFGPDGNLYVLESGEGTDSSDPNVASAPDVVFIPGLVSERGGYTGAITRVDINNPEGGQEQIFVGLASFREYNPLTGEDRIISIGPNGFTITPDGTVYVASGGGLAPATADSIAPFSDLTRGLVRVDGLFDGNGADATLTPIFDSVAYGSQNGPDGATTLFNTQSNLNDVVYRPEDGKLYAVDAARNVMYGLGKDGTTVESATVIPKRPPVLTPPQYAAVLAAGGNPTADYAVEIDTRTFKNANSLPDTPGRAAAPTPSGSGAAPTFPGALPPGPPPPGLQVPETLPAGIAPPRGEDSTVGTTNAAVNGSSSPPNAAAEAGVPGFLPIDPTFPGPSDPQAPPVLPGNIYTPYFDPFFGYANADKLVLPAGERGSYTVSNLYSFGDRLADDGGTFGAVPFFESIGVPTPYTSAPYSQSGSLSDGPKWTTSLSQILGIQDTGQDTSFAYESATARLVNDPSDPFQTVFNFEGQVNLFKSVNAGFLPTDLVTVTFGGNDLTVPGVIPTAEDVDLTVNAIIDGLQSLADLGAKHFLVTNLPDITLAPLFGDPAIAGALGIDSSIYGPLTEQFNASLATALGSFKSETGLDVKELDLNKLFDGIAADPAAYGFLNVTESVLANPPFPGSTPVYNPDIVGQDPLVQHGTLFIDPFFNPTALGQSIIAETARGTLV